VLFTVYGFISAKYKCGQCSHAISRPLLRRANLCSQVYGVKRDGAEVYIKMSAGCHALSYVLAILHVYIRCLLGAIRSPMYLLYYIHAIYTPATSALARRCTGGIACSIVSTWWCPNLKARCSKLGT
jgi:hypothetical protein